MDENRGKEVTESTLLNWVALIVTGIELLVEMNNRWPWQPKTTTDSEDEDI